MRATFLVWFCVIAVCGSVLGAQTQFPYELTVGTGPVDVRSGPGPQYYATGQLAAGAKIQVYRHDSDWLAIRPPAGSFSLVKSDRLEATNQAGVARVTNDDVTCHLGSNVAQIDDHVSWVRLRKDELVELIDGDNPRSQTPAGDAGDEWRRISPPAGEFRWVNAAAVQKARVAKAPARGSRREAIRIPGDGRQFGAPTEPNQQMVEEQTAPTGGVTGAADDSADAKWIARDPRLRDSLDDIELRLSLMVAKEMRAWRIGQLRDRLEAVMENLRSEEDRLRAQHLAKRIGKFEELQNRFVETMGDSYVPDVPKSSASANDTTPSLVERVTGVRYDGSGWLVPVHSTKQTAPPYALLDAEGDVLQYVSPTPGLNLHRYVRKQVGIFGHRGHRSSLKKPHLTAERVVDLRRHLR